MQVWVSPPGSESGESEADPYEALNMSAEQLAAVGRRHARLAGEQYVPPLGGHLPPPRFVNMENVFGNPLFPPEIQQATFQFITSERVVTEFPSGARQVVERQTVGASSSARMGVSAAPPPPLQPPPPGTAAGRMPPRA